MPRVFDEPSRVDSDADEVQLIGPDALRISLTPEAAIRTAGRLIAASAEAIAKGKRRIRH